MLETGSCGSAGSDSLYDMSLEKSQLDSVSDTASRPSSAKSKVVESDLEKVETDFEKVPSSLGSDVIVDPDGNSNGSSLFNLVVTDESNDEGSDSCPVSPDVNLDSSSGSSLFSVSKKPQAQQEKVNTDNHLIDNNAKSLPSSSVGVKTDTCLSHTVGTPHVNTTAGGPERKPATLPRSKVDNVTPPATGSPSLRMPPFASDGPSRKVCPKIMPRRSSSEGILQVSSPPVLPYRKSDKEKPPVMPRKNSGNSEDVDRTAPIPKPRRKRNTVTNAPERVVPKPSSNQGSPGLQVNTKAVTQLSTFKKDFNDGGNISWSAENSPVMFRKVLPTELENMKQLLRPLSSYSGGLTPPMSSQRKIMPKSASTDQLKGEESLMMLPSANPAIEMAPFEEHWQERFMGHNRRSKTMKYSGMMRIRSQLVEVKGTKLQTHEYIKLLSYTSKQQVF